MGNPYYIAPDNTGLNIANMGINFADMLMRRKQADADLSLKRETLAESIRQHNVGAWGTPEAQPGMPTLQQRQVGAQEEQNRIAGAKLGVLGAQFKPTDAAKAIGLARGAGLEKVLEPEITAIKGYGADPQYTMERAHDDFVSNWGEKKADILNRLQDDYAGRLAKDPAFAASKEGKRIETLMNNIYADQNGDFVSSLVFPGVAQAKGMIRGKVQSEITKNLREGYVNKSIYGPNGEVAEISIPKGQNLLLPQGWTDKDPVTGDIREYNFAVKQGYKGIFTQWDKERKKAGASNVNMTVGTQTQLQKDIIEQQTAIDTLNTIEQQFKDEYLTYFGRGKQFAGKIGEKIGTQVVDENWLAARQNWYQVTKSNQIAFRKWATGVAGGEKELAEIAKAYPDPDKNSPTEFKANLRQAKLNAIRLKKRYNMFLLNGVTPTKDKLSTVSLSEIKVDESELAGGISQEAQNYLKNLGK